MYGAYLVCTPVLLYECCAFHFPQGWLSITVRLQVRFQHKEISNLAKTCASHNNMLCFKNYTHVVFLCIFIFKSLRFHT